MLQPCSSEKDTSNAVKLMQCSAKLRYENNMESFKTWNAKTRVLNLILDATKRMTKLTYITPNQVAKCDLMKPVQFLLKDVQKQDSLFPIMKHAGGGMV